jgi:hypothetical protein
MFKLPSLAPAAALLMLTSLLTQPAFAAITIVNDGTYGDPEFIDDCKDGTVDPSAGNNACEYAVIETKPTRTGTGGNASMYTRTADFSEILDSTNISNTNWGDTQETTFDWVVEGNQSGTGSLKLTITLPDDGSGNTEFSTSVTGV